MTRPLRRRHRAGFLVLGVVLPLGFAVGILARKPVPAATELPSGLKEVSSDFAREVWTKGDLWPGRRGATRLLRDATNRAAVELQFLDLVKPDVLVYWVAATPAGIEALPEDARLLGVLSNNAPLPIPAEARASGRLVLYSLADHEILAVSDPLAL